MLLKAVLVPFRSYLLVPVVAGRVPCANNIHRPLLLDLLSNTSKSVAPSTALKLQQALVHLCIRVICNTLLMGHMRTTLQLSTELLSI